MPPAAKLRRSSPARASSPTRGEPFVSRVVEATLEELARVGFERLSIPEVATRAQVNKTSIYRRWPTKRELVVEALRAPVAGLGEAPDLGSLRADLLAIGGRLSAFVDSPIGTALVRVAFSNGGSAELHTLAMSAVGESSLATAAVVLERALSRGELRADLDPALVVFTLAGAIIHRAFVERAAPSPSHLEALVDLLLRGAATR